MLPDENTSLTRREQYCREVAQTSRWMLLWIVILAGLLLLSLGIGAWINRHILEWWNPDSLLSWLPIIGLTGLFVLSLVFLEKTCKPSLQACPHCHRALEFSTQARFLLIVTRRCPHCAQAVFEAEPVVESEEFTEFPTSRLLNRKDLEAAQEVSIKAARAAIVPWLVAGGLLVFAGAVIGQWLAPQAALWMGDILAPFFTPLLLTPGGIVCCYSLIACSKKLQSLFHCSHCRAEISADSVTLSTGHCCRCGGPVLNDAFPGLEPGNREPAEKCWTIAEFASQSQRYLERAWIGCFIGTIPALLFWMLLYWGLPIVFGETSEANLFVVLALAIAVFALQLSGIAIYHFVQTRHLRCPGCHREIASSNRFVISSKRCCYCGITVLQDSGIST